MAPSPIAFAAAFALLAGLTLSTANAADGVTTGSVNLRSGPSVKHARIAVIPAGARVKVLGCARWCEVAYAGRRGWASAAYISRGRVPLGAMVLPDQSRCHGPEVWNTPWCEWPIERSVREFANSTRDFQNRRDR